MNIDSGCDDVFITTLVDTPTELLLEIIKLLNVKDVSYLMMVNTFFNKLCLQNQVFHTITITDREWLQLFPKKCYRNTQSVSCKLWESINLHDIYNEGKQSEIIKQLFKSIYSLKHLKVHGIHQFDVLYLLNANNLISIQIHNGGNQYFFGNFLLNKINCNILKSLTINNLYIDMDFIQFVSKSKLECLCFDEIVFPTDKCTEMDQNYIEKAFESISKTLKSVTMGFNISTLTENELQYAVFKTLLLSPEIYHICIELIQTRKMPISDTKIEEYMYYFSQIHATQFLLKITQFNQQTMQKIITALPHLFQFTLIFDNINYLKTNIHFEEMIDFMLKVNISDELNIDIVDYYDNYALEIIDNVLEKYKLQKQEVVFKTLSKFTIKIRCLEQTYAWKDILCLVVKIKNNLRKIANQIIIKLQDTAIEKIKSKNDWLNVVSLAQNMYNCELQKHMEFEDELFEDLICVYTFKL